MKEFSLWIRAWMGLSLLVVALVSLLLAVIVFSRPIKLGMVDLSWPNCNRLSNRLYTSVIVGSSGGLDFRPNPCLGNEVRLSNNYVLYTNTGNPGFPRIRQLGSAGPLNCPSPTSLVCYSFNYGYQAARYSMRQADLSAAAGSTFWWLDVEAINSWTNIVAANRADILGMIDALQSSQFLTPKVGIYTANSQWLALVGHWNVGLPVWLGTGDSTLQQATQSCRQSFLSGSPIVLSQYTIGNLDFNFTCRPWRIRNYFND
jgi:hypothetical protein